MSFAEVFSAAVTYKTGATHSVTYSPPPLAAQVGGTKTRGEEVRKGIEDAQTEKQEELVA